MEKQNNHTMAKVATVMAVGTAAYMMAKPKSKDKQTNAKKSSTSSAIKNAGVIIDTISGMLG